eukprot:1384962-Amorphochlora_amoeboformis.AAC.2
MPDLLAPPLPLAVFLVVPLVVPAPFSSRGLSSLVETLPSLASFSSANDAPPFATGCAKYVATLAK